MIVELLIVNFLTIGYVVESATLTRVNHLSARCLFYKLLGTSAKHLPLHNLLDRASLSPKFAPPQLAGPCVTGVYSILGPPFRCSHNMSMQRAGWSARREAQS